MKRSSPDLGSQILGRRHASGLGVPCAEAQADGLPCAELALDCADCERGAAAVHAASSLPPRAPSSPIRRPTRRASGAAAERTRGGRRA